MSNNTIWSVNHTDGSFVMELSERGQSDYMEIEQVLRLFKHALNAAGYTWVADIGVINEYGRLTTAYETEDHWMNKLKLKPNKKEK